MSTAFAIIKTGGKQYKVSEGQRVKIEKLPHIGEGKAASDAVVFDDVLMVAEGDRIDIGRPRVEGAKVTAKVVKQGRARKIIILKYRPKKRYKKKMGHRQPYTEVQIEEIIV
ncbi:MAG: 50S ribosomal protein L21 [Parcubacteria group bacterium]|nr:50S ribosomal protein L21 [Parcubacteria group bacterium]